jgi:hypothetical protein
MCAARRTAGVGAQCYERAVKKWLLAAGVILAGALIALVMRSRSTTPHAPSPDPVVEDFRSVERESIAAFNEALRRQRAQEIDEIGLATEIERAVLVPWHAMQARVAAAPVPAERGELYAVMRRYIEERELAWRAYVAALRADSEAEARPRYDVYHQKNAQAQDDARVLGGLLRAQ